MKVVIYTIGTSNRTWREFVEILHYYGIQCAVDVRRFPKSYWSHFQSSFLSEKLPEEGIQYEWLGDSLGGFRKGGYETYLQSEAFKIGLEKLKHLSEQRPTVLFCKERFPWKCHRRFISAVLQEEGYHIIHILEKNRTWTPSDKQE